MSGHVFRVEGQRRPVWRAKYRLPDGRQVQRTIGPAWTARGRPLRGFYTRRTAEAWLRDTLGQARLGTLPGMVRKIIVIFHGVMERARRTYHLPHNPVAGIEKPRSAAKTSIEVFSPEEVHALVRRVPGRRGRLPDRRLHRAAPGGSSWRCAGAPSSSPAPYIRVTSSHTQGRLTTPKSGKVRSVPMAPEVGEALARLNQARPHVTDDRLVFERVPGSFLDASALLRRYKQAALRRARV